MRRISWDIGDGAMGGASRKCNYGASFTHLCDCVNKRWPIFAFLLTRCRQEDWSALETYGLLQPVVLYRMPRDSLLTRHCDSRKTRFLFHASFFFLSVYTYALLCFCFLVIGTYVSPCTTWYCALVFLSTVLFEWRRMRAIRSQTFSIFN